MKVLKNYLSTSLQDYVVSESVLLYRLPRKSEMEYISSRQMCSTRNLSQTVIPKPISQTMAKLIKLRQNVLRTKSI